MDRAILPQNRTFKGTSFPGKLYAMNWQWPRPSHPPKRSNRVKWYSKEGSQQCTVHTDYKLQSLTRLSECTHIPYLASTNHIRARQMTSTSNSRVLGRTGRGTFMITGGWGNPFHEEVFQERIQKVPLSKYLRDREAFYFSLLLLYALRHHRMHVLHPSFTFRTKFMKVNLHLISHPKLALRRQKKKKKTNTCALIRV